MWNKKVFTKLSLATCCCTALTALSGVAQADDQALQRQIEAQQRTMLSQQNNIDMLQDEIASLRGELEKMRYQMDRTGNAQPAAANVNSGNANSGISQANYGVSSANQPIYTNNGGVYSSSNAVSRGSSGVNNSITLKSMPKDAQAAQATTTSTAATQPAGPVTPMGNSNLQANQMPASTNGTTAAPTISTNKPAATANNSGVGLQPVDDTARQAYNAAYALVQQNNLQGAEQAFAKYVQDYPENALTPNAWYWLGQVQYVQKNYEQARLSFLNVARFVDSQKRPDALYKLGKITQYLGDNAKAQRYFQLVLEYYPTDAAASLAQRELQASAQ